VLYYFHVITVKLRWTET